MRPHRAKVALAGVALLFSSAIGLAFPLVVRFLLDAAFVTRNLVNLNTIAVGLLILFAIGGAFEVRHLRPIWGRLWRISVVEAFFTFGLVFVGVLVAGLVQLGWPAAQTVTLALL